MKTIDLRSDTVTLPTEEMYAAMRSAPLGDDVSGEDPTVNRLEQMAAARLGREAAMLVPTGTMGNLVALMTHTQRGDEVLVDPQNHVFYYEAGGMASVAGLMPHFLRSDNGLLDPEEVVRAIRQPNAHFPRPALLCLENTHNRSGGRVTPLALHRELCRVAHEHGLKVHLDGARIFNAAIAAGVAASKYAREVDSVMFCLSKGLSCPIGSLLVGDAEFIELARRRRKVLGGGMRQAGVIAAAGIVALETMIDRLADDHANARSLAISLAQVPGLRVDPESVETNMVVVDHSESGLGSAEILGRWRSVGVLAGARSPETLRLVIHRHISTEDVHEAAARIAAHIQ